MALTKTKSLTISVIALSVLLAVALIATIVLAAFSFTAKATTTLSFAGGITLTATEGIDSTTGTWKAYLVSSDGTVTATNATSTGITQGIALAPIKIKNNATQPIIMAVAVTIEDDGSKLAPRMYVSATGGKATASRELIDSSKTTRAVNFSTATVSESNTIITAAGDKSLQWVTFTVGANTEQSVTKYINTVFADVDGLAGLGLKATFYVSAVYVGQSIENAITSGTFGTWNN